MTDRRFIFRNSGALHRLLDRLTPPVSAAELRQKQIEIMREDETRRARWAKRSRPWWRRFLGPYA
jgi:hypothetical protein